MEDRLNEGVRVEDFLIVEWDFTGDISEPLKTTDDFTPKAGKWYAYMMLPGYSGPYFSPIRVEKVKSIGSSGKRFTLDFYNARYAEGVRNFSKKMKILSRGDGYLVAELMDDKSERRTAIVAEFNRSWLEAVVPTAYAKSHPMDAAEAAMGDFQGYFERLAGEGQV
jgi:hypothetical protein